MKKYVILSALKTDELEAKVIDHIDKGYEPCGGLNALLVTGNDVVFNQAMWLNPPILVSGGGKLTFDDVVEIGKKKMEDGN